MGRGTSRATARTTSLEVARARRLASPGSLSRRSRLRQFLFLYRIRVRRSVSTFPSLHTAYDRCARLAHPSVTQVVGAGAGVASAGGRRWSGAQAPDCSLRRYRTWFAGRFGAWHRRKEGAGRRMWPTISARSLQARWGEHHQLASRAWGEGSCAASAVTHRANVACFWPGHSAPAGRHTNAAVPLPQPLSPFVQTRKELLPLPGLNCIAP